MSAPLDALAAALAARARVGPLLEAHGWIFREARMHSGVLLVFGAHPEGAAIVLDRVETPWDKRERGLVRPALREFLAACREAGVERVYLTILLDNENDYALVGRLAGALHDVGFRRDESDPDDETAYAWEPGFAPHDRTA